MPLYDDLVAFLGEDRIEALCMDPAYLYEGLEKFLRPGRLKELRAGRVYLDGADVTAAYDAAAARGDSLAEALRALGLELDAQRQGIAGLRWHVTRHTYAARVLQDGKQIFDLSILLGHASVMTTQKYYAHLAPDQLAAAVAGVGRAEGGEG